MTGRIAVTGAAGGLGRPVVADLVGHGYGVVAVDRVPGEVHGVTVAPWDGRDVAGLAEAIDGCDGLVHLAAIPQAWSEPDEVVFGNNTMATFAALQAAAQVGVRRAAIASSGSAYGIAFSKKPIRFSYVPVDEDHPMRNHDPYGLSKEVDERTAAMFCRRFDMSVAALRFHWICNADLQRERVGSSSPHADAELRNLWGYVDFRDAARACRLALEAAARRPYGFQPMNIVAADALIERPLAEVLAEHAPDIEIRRPLGPTDGAYAIDRAREVIGWVPEHSWRQEHDTV